MEFINPVEGLLEVVMEETDQEVLVPQNAPYRYDLPPIPTFDLHAQQYTYLQPTALPKPKTIAKVPKFIAISSAATCVPVIVYNKPDEVADDLTQASNEELNFYSVTYADLKLVENQRLHCSICDRHLGCGYATSSKIREHKMLKVLICKDCFLFYGDGKFPLDDSDNTEIYCRWCGQGGALVCCSFCPKVFCNKCVKRNFSMSYLKDIEKAKEWACFCCAQRPLWPLRALCWALLQYLRTTAGSEDKSRCCRKEKPVIKKKPPQTPKAPITNPMVVIQPGVLQQTSSVPSLNITKSIQPAAPRPATRRQLPVRAPASIPRPVPVPVPVRPVAPVPRPQASANKNSELIPTNMPEVRVDHSAVDTTTVRLRMSNGKLQYLRIHLTGSCQRIPTFPNDPSFTLTSVQHAFRANKLVFDKLKTLKEKVEGGKLGGVQAEAQCIQSTLNAWKTLISEIENDLSHNLKVHEASERKKTDDVIDVSDDEDMTMSWGFTKACKATSFGIESDVEIIDSDDEAPPKTEKRKLNEADNNSTAKKARVETHRQSNGETPEILSDKDIEMMDVSRPARVKYTKETSHNQVSENDNTFEEQKEKSVENENNTSKQDDLDESIPSPTDSCETVVDEEFIDTDDAPQVDSSDANDTLITDVNDSATEPEKNDQDIESHAEEPEISSSGSKVDDGEINESEPNMEVDSDVRETLVASSNETSVEDLKSSDIIETESNEKDRESRPNEEKSSESDLIQTESSEKERDSRPNEEKSSECDLIQTESSEKKRDSRPNEENVSDAEDFKESLEENSDKDDSNAEDKVGGHTLDTDEINNEKTDSSNGALITSSEKACASPEAADATLSSANEVDVSSKVTEKDVDESPKVVCDSAQTPIVDGVTETDENNTDSSVIENESAKADSAIEDSSAVNIPTSKDETWASAKIRDPIEDLEAVLDDTMDNISIAEEDELALLGDSPAEADDQKDSSISELDLLESTSFPSQAE